MVGSGYWETAQLFVDALQPAVARVTPAILRGFPPYGPDESTFRLELSEPKAPLFGADGRYSVALALRFRVVPDETGDDRWEVQTFAYFYQLYLDGREHLAFHWDHEGASAGGVSTPHAHFGKELPHPDMRRADRDNIQTLAAAHIPTGHIAFTELLRMVTRDFGVEPLRTRGETVEQSKIGAERVIGVAEAVLKASFEWASRPPKSVARS